MAKIDQYRAAKKAARVAESQGNLKEAHAQRLKAAELASSGYDADRHRARASAHAQKLGISSMPEQKYGGTAPPQAKVTPAGAYHQGARIHESMAARASGREAADLRAHADLLRNMGDRVARGEDPRKVAEHFKLINDEVGRVQARTAKAMESTTRAAAEQRAAVGVSAKTAAGRAQLQAAGRPVGAPADPRPGSRADTLQKMRDLEHGPRGGRFYRGQGGQKIYPGAKAGQ